MAARSATVQPPGQEWKGQGPAWQQHGQHEGTQLVNPSKVSANLRSVFLTPPLPVAGFHEQRH